MMGGIGREKPSKSSSPASGPCPLKPDKTGHAEAVEELPQGLDAREAAAVEALLQQPTLARAAAVVGINERTLRRWMSSPAFRNALLEARRAAFSQAVG